MTYPDVPLEERFRTPVLGTDISTHPSTWSWLDMTTSVQYARTRTAVIGGADGESETNTSLDFTLKNPDGEWSHDNPAAPLWPSWDVGWPVEYAINPDGAGWKIVAIGFVSGLIPEFPGGTNVMPLMKVTCGGAFVRLGQSPPAGSPVTRTHAGITSGLRGYWSMEDPAGSGVAVNALPGGPSMAPNLAFESPPTFGAVSSQPGQRSLATFDDGQSLIAPVSTSTTGFQVSMLLSTNGLVSGIKSLVDVFMSGGSRGIWRLQVDGANIVPVGLIGGADPIAAPAFTWPHEDELVWVDWRMTQNGANVDWEYKETAHGIDSVTGEATASAFFSSGSFAGTVGAATHIRIAGTLDLNNVSIGAMHVRESPYPAQGGFSAVSGWAGNRADGRIAGMASEAGIAHEVADDFGVKMGPQRDASVLANFRDAAKTDHGILTDHMGVIRYMSLHEQTGAEGAIPGITLDGGSRELFGGQWPARDFQPKINRAVATGANGGLAIAEDTADIDRFGRYESTRGIDGLNVSQLGQLDDHANLALVQGTSTRARWPSLTVDFLRAPQLIPDWLAILAAGGTMPLGAFVTVTNPPSQLSQDPTLLQVRGVTMTAGPGRRKWTASLNVIPAEHLETFELDTDRLDVPYADVIAAATDTATTLYVASGVRVAGSMPITTALQPTRFPVDLSAGGERVTLTANVAAPISDPFTRTAANTWGSIPAGAYGGPYAWAAGGAGGTVSATDFATTGTVATHSVPVANAFRQTALDVLAILDPDVAVSFRLAAVPTGANYEPSVVIRRINSSGYTLRIEVVPTTNAMNMVIFSPSSVTLARVSSGLTFVGGTLYRMRLQALGPTLRAKLWIASGTEPDWMLDLSDTEQVRAGSITVRSGVASGNTNAKPLVFTYDNFSIINVQAMTVTRSVNSVVKAQPAGSRVHLWTRHGLGMGLG